jgi:hypothetical protein
VYESEAARHERTAKRLIIALIVAILLLVASNMAWLYVFSQYDISSESYTVDSGDEGVSNYLEAGNDGEINNGESTVEEKGND